MIQTHRRSVHTLTLAAIVFALVWALLPAASPAAGQQPADAAEATTTDKPGPDNLTAETGEAVPVAGVNEFVPGESESGLWIVELVDDALPAAAQENPELFPAIAGEARLDAQSQPARAYRDQLVQAQAEVIQQAEQEIGRAAEVAFRYTTALNGFAIRVDQNEAREIAKLDGVKRVQPDFIRELQTDAGPEFINALEYVTDPGSGNEIVSPEPGVDTLGEGVVAGIIDSGISYDNPSFAATVPVSAGGDGYVFTYEGAYFGVCDPANDGSDPNNQADEICNDKLIGAWNFVPGSEYGARDDDGHGSHTGSTTAGNQVLATVSSGEVSRDVTISGVAPHAQIISYKVCGEAFGGGCGGSAIVAAIEQSIDDGVVDVLNYSIGSTSPGDPWSDADALAFLNARAAGIFVATSAGNSGPLPATVGSPAGTPWMTSVGASQHNRSYVQSITVTGGPTFDGKGFTPGLETPADVVYAGAFDNPLCLPDEFPAGTDFSGKIVICDRGEIGRVAKSVVVADLGAVGYVLVNDPLNAASLNSDAFAVPGVHLSNTDGTALKDLVESGAVTATITPTERVVNDAFANLQASFSSRGPNLSADYITPDVTAPGVDIIAAIGIATPENDGGPIAWGFLSGTSMSSPHTAGAGALLSSAHPDWSPAQIQSALMLTARYDGLLKEDGTTPADPYDYGGGYIDVALANATGLIMDETKDDYLAANPAEEGDPTTINHASLSNQDCLDTCEWTRTFTPVADATYTVTTESDEGLTLTASQASVTAAVGTDFELSVTASPGASPVGEPLFGRVILTPDDASLSVAHLTVAVIPSAGVVPEEIVIDTRRDAGSKVVEDLRTIGADPLGIQVTGLNGGIEEEFAIPGDPTNGDPFDTPEGTVFTTVQATAETTRLIAEITASESPDLDLFVGFGDTPSSDTLLCVSASGTALEFCEIVDPEPGTYWILVQNWQPSSPEAVDAFTLSTAVIGSDQGNLTVIPSDPSPALNTPYDLTVAYDLEMDPGRSYFGSIILSSGDTQIGEIPVTVNRFADDVVKTTDSSRVRPNDTVSYEILVRGNITDEDMVYRISDQVPDGLTLVPSSVLVDGQPSEEVTVDGDTIVWTPTQPTTVGADGDYMLTTGVNDDTCAENSYLNLQEFGIPPGSPFDGDTFAFRAFASGEPLPFYDDAYEGVVFTDNGYQDFTYDGIVYDAEPIPDPADPNGIIADLMQDLVVTYDPTPGAERGIRLASTGNTADDFWVIDYDQVEPAGGGAQSTFQVFGFRSVVDAPGAYEYIIAFDQAGGLAGPVTVGLENITGLKGTPVVSAGDATGVITDTTVLCFDYAGATADPTVLTFDATVDPATRGAITNTAASIDTADPYSKIETTSATINGPGGGTPPPTDPPTPGPTTPPTETPGGIPLVTVTATDDTFTFIRSEATDEPLTVVFETAGDAVEGEDYVDLGSTITIPADARAETLTVTELPGAEGGEEVEVTVLDGEHYEAGNPDTATVILEGAGDPDPDPGTEEPVTDVGGVTVEPGTVTRYEGATRIETAVDISQALFPEDDSADAVMLARSDVPFDALAATPLAKTQNGPLLLTNSDELHPATAAEIDRVLADGGQLILLGGTAALSPAIEDALAEVYSTTRLEGPTRVETAVDIAEFIGDPEAILVATSENFPDALTSGAAAAHANGVVLLTPEADVHPAVQAYLDANATTTAFAIGGPAARAFTEMTPVVGAGREETSVMVAETFFDDPDMIGLARGDEFADALTGGAHAALTGGPVLLTPTDFLHPAVQDYTCSVAPIAGFIYGGTSAISEAVADALLGAVTGEACPA